MRELTIGTRLINDTESPLVIAEIGNNHQGDLTIANEMIRKAAACGAGAVKFQVRDNATLYSQALLDKPYENENSFGKTYGEHRAALELDQLDLRDTQMTAALERVWWFATAFDERSADVLADMKSPAIKLASGALTDTPLLRHVASLQIPILLSTGGGNERNIERAVQTISAHHTHFALLHCTASYPCAFHELNLRCILTLRNRYPDTVIGWSGHDNGIAMALVAYAFGASIIEKHFTLNRAMKGTDHAFSLEPAGLAKLCRDLDRARVAIGDGIKIWFDSERGPISKMRRVPTPDGWQITGAPSAHD